MEIPRDSLTQGVEGETNCLNVMCLLRVWGPRLRSWGALGLKVRQMCSMWSPVMRPPSVNVPLRLTNRMETALCQITFYGKGNTFNRTPVWFWDSSCFWICTEIIKHLKVTSSRQDWKICQQIELLNLQHRAPSPLAPNFTEATNDASLWA